MNPDVANNIGEIVVKTIVTKEATLAFKIQSSQGQEFRENNQSHGERFLLNKVFKFSAFTNYTSQLSIWLPHKIK